ncbi:MAG TPA: threonine/serine dehydratase [Pyrinomonadaceae bacterium]|nr:threonine/serine dehydratase [Pyrinomonadaceae bacterium]
MDLISISAVEEARRRIANAAIRTPLVRLNGPDTRSEIYLKLENLQPIGSFKIRGAANAIACLSPEQLERGVVTASAGNMAQGVAWCARRLGIPCTVIAPATAPDAKINAIERLGGRVVKVSFDEWWRAFEQRSYPGVTGRFIHAFDDLDVMAGNGTIALEILEDLPDVDAVIIPWGGGGLTCGIASTLRSLRPGCKIFTAEVSTGAPLAASMAAGTPTTIDYQPSWVDGIGARAVFPQMFERARSLIDGTLVADLDSIASSLRLLAQHNRIIAEGAGACPVACALSATLPGKIVCIISGGNIDPSKLATLLTGEKI